MKERALVVAITGVPAAGKTTFSSVLAKALVGQNADFIEINGLVDKYHAVTSHDEFNTKIVDVAALSSHLKKDLLRDSREHRLIFLIGHLAPELDIEYDVAIVLRHKLKDLAKRMKKRKYPAEKVRENIIAEAMDYCGMKIMTHSKQTFEIEGSREKTAAISYFRAILSGKKLPMMPKPRYQSRMKELQELINTNKKLGL